jgi:transposase
MLNRPVRESVDWASLQALGVLGLDEIALRKGHRDFVTSASARPPNGALTVVAVLPDRSPRDRAGLLGLHCLKRLQATRTRVCTARYDGDIHAARAALPRARVVIDRLHVPASLTSPVLAHCASKRSSGCRPRCPKTRMPRSRGTWWPFRKPWANLTPEEREQLDRRFAHAPALKAAHRLREVLTLSFDAPLTQARARDYLEAWGSLVKASRRTCCDSFLTTLDERRDAITHDFLDRQSSGFVAGLNHQIKVLKRRCYGIFSPARLLQRRHLDRAGYR